MTSNHPQFYAKFIQGMSAGRSSSIERLRSHASQIFTDIDQALFVKSVQRSQDARICELLGIVDDPLGNKTYRNLAPVLFENEDTNQLPGLFRNPVLFQVNFSSGPLRFTVLTN